MVAVGAGDRLTVDQALHLARILRGFDDLAKAGIDPWQHAEPETAHLVRVSLVELRRQARRALESVQVPDAVAQLLGLPARDGDGS